MRKITLEQFLSNAEKIHKNKYDYSKVVYLDNKTKICIICPVHGEFWQIPNNHLKPNNKSQGCSKCRSDKLSLLYRLDKNKFLEKARTAHGNKYDYSKVNYINSHIKIIITCSEHGDFEQTPLNHIYNNQGCPGCKESKGEKTIKSILDKNNIRYISQFKLPNYSFRYDIYLIDYNLLIEFHGRQHYEPVEAFGGEEEFKETIKRDAFKRSLAREYKIPLLEFNYKQFKELSKKEFEEFVISKIKLR